MDRLEISVGSSSVPNGGAATATGGSSLMENNHVTENHVTTEPEVSLNKIDLEE